MQVVTGLWIGLAGCLAALAGLAGMRRMRSLRLNGAMAWAMVVPDPADPAVTPGRTLVQFSLGNGRIIEHPCPRHRKSAALKLGQKVLVWYDPADPSDVLVYGHQGLRANVLFVAGGFALIVAGVMIASLAS
jgi:hypothetical protein